VIHRDIKPANILLTSREAYGVERPKITDFGVAKLAAGQITTTGQMLGTPAFMPPEQFTGAPIDGRADIFSLGVILYWMATGEQPFPGETMTAVSYKVVHTEPVPPRKLNPSIPAALDGLILKCLAKSPADRYQSGEELAQELAGLRTASRTDLQRTAFSMPPIDSQATIDVRTPNTIPIVPANLTQSTAISSPVGTVPAAKKTDYRLILGAVAAVLVLSVGWLLLRNKNQSSHTATQLPIASPVVAANPPVPTPAPVAEKISHAVPSPASAPTKVEKKVAPVPVAPVSPKATPPAPKLAAVEFDPTTLNPKENSKLKIDANHMPATLDFTVEMNGKIYFHRSADGNKAEYEGLFVPPGVQEFRVTASSGKVTKSSNIVSTEFKAKKKKTLKIELRPETKTAGNNETDLSPDTQIFITLK
jgi:serine/threonine-protein kinase